jgi:hypothetical protein
MDSTRVVASKPASAFTFAETEHHSPELKAAGSNPAGRTNDPSSTMSRPFQTKWGVPSVMKSNRYPPMTVFHPSEHLE